MRGFYRKVSNILEELIREKYGFKLEPPIWELPQKQEFGDLSSMAALKLASRLKSDPLEIATQIKASLEGLFKKEVDKIEILRPGFINIFVSKDTLIDSLNTILKAGEGFFQGKEGKKILIEFLSANPTGPLSIAHGRQAIVGDVIANILEFFGNSVEREYYLNDTGRQIELFGESIKSAAEAIKQGQEDWVSSIPQGGYKGSYIADIAKSFLERENKSDALSFGIENMLSSIKEDLKKIGVKKFNHWISQKRMIERGEIDKVLAYLHKNGLIYEKEGALWFSSTNLGDDKDMVVKKVDGELTYFASDIAYHKNKAERGYAELINLWGPDHHGYVKRVETAFSASGYNKETLKIIIIQLVTLKTKERMSKRAGNIILLSDLVDEVGKDAARFYYLTRRNSSPLEFDLDLAKEASFDNPLYYIQYVCARIESIFRKAKANSFEGKFSKFLKNPEEINLLRNLLQFSYCLEKAYYTLEPVFIVEFLKALASSFHKFYEKVRVIEEDKDITQSRLNLLAGLRVVFRCGLGLLGIKPVEKM